MKKYFFEKIWLAAGQTGKWHSNILVTVDDSGFIASIKPVASASGEGKITGFALPAFSNSHSHAFQRLLVGRTECRHPGDDNFWSWRQVMYQFANRITSEDLKNIAAFAYLEMVKAGYAAVAEFHYLHHQPSGQAYDDPAEMSWAIIEAANDVGIALTHLPVLYQRGGFDNRPLDENQRRFHHDTDGFLALVEELGRHFSRHVPQHQIGVAFHSLRAVPPESLTQVIMAINPEMPVHIHIAEQVKEVEDCLKHTGARPVDWLLSHQTVDHRWCLVHATHMTADEITALVNSRAVVGLCPATEANLGDGFFPLADFIGAGGAISIGTDSNGLIDPIEETRWLEYGARLREQRRNIVTREDEFHTGTALFAALHNGGARALGQKTGTISVGCRADIMVIDNGASALCAVPDSDIIDALIFAGTRHHIRDVMVAGAWVVKDHNHHRQDEIRRNYQKTVRQLGQNFNGETAFI